MGELRELEFFLLRYVPDAVRDEFVNIGVVMIESAARGDGYGAGAAADGFAEARFVRDWRRVRCVDPQADVEMLEAMEREIQGQLARGGDREALLKKLQDSFSNALQISPLKACLAADPAEEIEALAKLYCEDRRPRAEHEASGRRRILGQMRDAFEQAGVWQLLRKEIAAAQYTYKGDPLKIDCGYRPNGVVKMFQAVSVAAGADAAKVLGFSYPQLAAGIRREENAGLALTAVVEDDLARSDEAVGFALATLEMSGIAVVEAREMAGVAEVARKELR